MADNPKYLPLTLWSGDDYSINIHILDMRRHAKSVTGSTLRWLLACNDHASPLLTKSEGDGITLTDASEGLAVLTLDSADTENLCGGYYHELKLIDGDGKIRTIAYGLVHIQSNLH